MSKFKVGDRVLVKAGQSDTSKQFDGKICTIFMLDSTTAALVEEPSPKGGVYLSELSLWVTLVGLDTTNWKSVPLELRNECNQNTCPTLIKGHGPGCRFYKESI